MAGRPRGCDSWLLAARKAPAGVVGNGLGIVAWVAEVNAAFKGVNKADVEEVLDSLAALGILAAYESRGTRRWKFHPRGCVATAESHHGVRRIIAKITRLVYFFGGRSKRGHHRNRNLYGSRGCALRGP